MQIKLLRDSIFKNLCYFACVITITVCIGIIIYVFIQGYSQLNFDFITKEPNPTISEDNAGGISTPIIGTLLLTIIGTSIAFPWGLGSALYYTNYAKKGRMLDFLNLAVEVLSGVPTIVIAIFGLAVFTNPFWGFLSSKVVGVEGFSKAFGRSFLVSGITMGIMILPYIIKTCTEAINSVPKSYMEASYALGAGKRQGIIRVLIPAAKNGIITSIILGMGRIIGDTAIVWLTLGGTLRMTGFQPWYSPENWLSTLKNTGSTLTSYIFYTSPAGEGNMPSVSFGASLILVLIIIFLNILTDYIGSIGKIQEER